MGHAQCDGNLLFGVLALQMDFITRDTLIDAMNAWALQKHRALAEILEERGAISTTDRELLEPLLRRHIEQHGGDPAQSLASLSSVQWMRKELATLGGADPDVQQSLDRLGADREEGPADHDPSATVPPRGSGEWSGARFRILRYHERGGLGEVFVAKDTELDREVAYKQIRRDQTDHAFSRSKFLLEAQITGGLEHPGIVPVYGLGVDQAGRPYYAMRFIKGDSLKDAIRRFHQEPTLTGNSGVRLLELQKLLRRFMDVCNAVAYAHSRGVLHRDIKPGNIMVGQYGETLVVDWGLAKVVGKADGSSPESTLRPPSASGSAETLPGSALGTPAFMSPEQAEGRLDKIGPESDVYSLGATLYCLLTGRVPIDDEDNVAALQRARQGEIKPPRQVRPDVPRPLEAICQKAMALKPEDRYLTPRALADDLERWLADEPVSAWHEPVAIRTRRWMRRHRTAVSGAVIALLVGLVGLSAVAVVQSRANDRLTKANAATTEARNEALLALAETKAAKKATDEALAESEESRKQAEAVSDFLIEAFRSPDPSQDGRAIMVVDLLDEAENKLHTEFRGSPQTKGAMLNALGETYRGLGLYDRAERAHKEALAVRESSLGADHQDTLVSRNNLGLACLVAGRTGEATALLEAALEIRQRKFGLDHPDTLATRTNLAMAYEKAGRVTEAIALEEATIKLKENKLGPEDPDTLTSRNNLTAAYYAAGRMSDAILMQERTVTLQETKLGPDDPATLSSRSNLAGLYYGVGRTTDAIKLEEKTLELTEAKLGPDHPGTLTSRNNLAAFYLAAGRPDKAIELHEATVKMQERRLAPDHPDTLTTRANLASAYLAAGRTDEAIALHEQTLKLKEKKLGLDHRDTLQSRNNLAAAYLEAGRISDAIRLHEGTLKLRESVLGLDHLETLRSRNNLAAAYSRAGRITDALRMHEVTLKLSESKLGREHPVTLSSRHNLASAYRDCGRTAEAVRLQEETLKSREKVLGPHHADTLKSRNSLAESYGAAGQPAKAIQMHEGTLKLCESARGTDHPFTFAVRNNLAQAYLATGRRTDAVRVFSAMIPAIDKVFAPGHPTALTILRNLAGAYESLARWPEAEALRRRVVPHLREREGPSSLGLADELQDLGFNLLKQSRWSEAIVVLRECLSIRDKSQPGDWPRFDSMSLLGMALLGQGKYSEAESLVVEGYQGMKAHQVTIPRQGKPRLAAAAVRVVRLYEAWGKADKAKEWRSKLADDLLDHGFPADPFAH